MARTPSIVFSEAFIRWLDNFSQSAAIDMCEGGDDAEMVAETCLTCLGVQGTRELEREYKELLIVHDYRDVLREAARHVKTL